MNSTDDVTHHVDIIVEIEPDDAGIPTEPPFLANRELASSQDDRLDGIRQRESTGQMLEEFVISECTGGRPRERALGQVTRLVQPASIQARPMPRSAARRCG